ncbi:hypothetical protein [Actinokineospora spheciospongiae]|uniref:hypothetical protein n=1 Tax=Actinokineospora spheciospongiae TaxID=909613 RepID=UPI000D70E59A|nr:hypothetical protein [Actinokineospora spheciospongiae]PWW65916.1 hypothetical protein DFQ13_102675 [Actinokineospora spheciospongiae]
MTAEPEPPDQPVEDPPPDKEAPNTLEHPGALHSVRNTMSGTFYMNAANFGVDGVSASPLTRATGRVQESVVRAALDRFVTPPRFDVALGRLHRDRVVVLRGLRGSGKRTAALTMLREVGASTLYALSPQVTLSELAQRDYDRGAGYLVADRRVADADDSDFDWGLVRDRVQDEGAYLVATVGNEASNPADGTTHVDWVMVEPERVLRAHWPHEWPETLHEVLCSVNRVSDVIELARRLAAGESPDAAVTHLDGRAGDVVADWFAAGPTRRQVLEVAALAFAVGTDERTYESMLHKLVEHYEHHDPEVRPGELAAVEDRLRQRRSTLFNENELVSAVRYRDQYGAEQTALCFTVPAYHRHVLAQLWARLDVRFWDAVRDWLNGVAGRHGDPVAVGLAELADVSFGEALPLLERWAGGEVGAGGQHTAVQTLWAMAYREPLASAALRVATSWVTRGSPARRWAGAMAFSGDIGVRYPHDAANRLWQLCVQSHTASGNVEMVLAALFSRLVHDTADAGIVLSVLRTKLRRFSRSSADRRLLVIAIRATLAVLSARDGRAAFVEFLVSAPDRIDLVAELWASVLCYRPTRLAALTALRQALDTAGPDALDIAERLGRALGATLPPDEPPALRSDFQTLAARKGVPIGPVLAALLTVLTEFPTGA